MTNGGAAVSRLGDVAPVDEGLHDAAGGFHGAGGGLDVRRSVSTILISHDLGLVARYTDDVLVMLEGHVLEYTAGDRRPTERLHARPAGGRPAHRSRYLVRSEGD